MTLWIFLYLIASIMSSAIAYFFYQSKNGWTRKYLIGIFVSMGWVFLLRAVWGLILWFNYKIDGDLLSIIIITPFLLVSIPFITYLNKQHKS